MKTITHNDTNISRYIFEDNIDVILHEDYVEAPFEVRNDESSFFFKYKMHSGNSTLHSDVTPPEDWEDGTYTFDGTNWTLIT